MRRIRLVLAVLSIAAVWVSPACKSNEVNQTANTTNNFMSVDEKGGTVTGPEGTKVRIPAGALDETVDIGIAEAQANEYPELIAMGGAGPSNTMPFAAAGKVWAFLPHGQQFFVEPTFWLPAPPGRFMVMKAQPGQQVWDFVADVTSSGGFVQFKSNSFSYYVLRNDVFGDPPADAANCSECLNQCSNMCSGGDAYGSDCIEVCMRGQCPTCSIGPGPGSGDAAVPPDSTTGCAPMCPKDGLTNGLPCTSCGSPQMCIGLNGPTQYRCTCMPKMSGDPGGTLTDCMPTAGGGTDSGVTDTAPPDTTPPSMCPTMTQTEGTASFSAWTPVSAYAFYKENFLSTSYFSQLWLVLSDKPDVCTRAVSRQGAANSKTLRIRLEARDTTTPTVFTAGTYASGTLYNVSGMTEQFNATCGPSGTGGSYSGGTVVITEATGGRYKGTFSFPAGASPASNGTFDVPTCASEGGGGIAGAECCK